jgi:hypothetical protein
MRAHLAALCFTVFAGAGVCAAQTTAPVANLGLQAPATDVYCAGFFKDTKLPSDIAVISGEQPGYKITFTQGESVYISQGGDHGVKVGDRFMVVRQEEDPGRVEWFKGQTKIQRAMGLLYSDVGQLRVINVQPKVSIAEVTFSCGMMFRGDIVRPFEERPAPPYKEISPFDHFAPVSGKPVGMIISSTDFHESQGRGAKVYVNLGSAQGVKVGDYLRFFRYQGKTDEWAPQSKGYQYQLYGFGSAPVRYEWKDLPREVIGEGIVLNASKNAAAVLITFSSADIYTGDDAEIE